MSDATTYAEMSAAELAALDFATLSDEDFHAAEARLDELAAESEAERADAAKRVERARAAQKEAFRRGKLRELEHEHGEVAVVWWHRGAKLGAVVVKRPKGITARKFLDRKEIKVEDAERLTRPCLVHPAKEDANQLFESFPGLIVQCAHAIVKMVTGRAEDEGKE